MFSVGPLSSPAVLNTFSSADEMVQSGAALQYYYGPQPPMATPSPCPVMTVSDEDFTWLKTSQASQVMDTCSTATTAEQLPHLFTTIAPMCLGGPSSSLPQGIMLPPTTSISRRSSDDDAAAPTGLPVTTAQKQTIIGQKRVHYSDSEKAARRRQQNLEHARTSRQRKKLRASSLESRNKALEEENQRLLQRIQYLEMLCQAHGVTPPSQTGADLGMGMGGQ